MVSQTLEKIITAEKQAAEQLESACQQAEQIREAALRKAREISDQVNRDYKMEVDALLAKNAAETEQIMRDGIASSLQEIQALDEVINAKREKAVQMVMNQIMAIK